MNNQPKRDIKSLPPESLPLLYNFIFPTKLIRENHTNLTASDLHKTALEIDTGDIYKLDAIGPISWSKLIMDQDMVRPTGPAGGDLDQSYPNPVVRPDSHTHTPGLTIPAYPTALPPTGPAGGDLKQNYPNPILKSILTTPGTYANPTIQVNEKGLITEIIPGNSVLYTVENIGTGAGLYSETLDNSHKLKSLKSTSPALSITIEDEEVILSLIDVIYKTDGNFSSPIYAPKVETDFLKVKKLNKTLYINAPGNNWTPNLSLGSLQSQIITGDIEIEFPTNYITGDEFTLIVIQDAVGGHDITLSTSYKIRNQETINTDPGAITKIECLVLSSATILTEVKSNYSV